MKCIYTNFKSYNLTCGLNNNKNMITKKENTKVFSISKKKNTNINIPFNQLIPPNPLINHQFLFEKLPKHPKNDLILELPIFPQNKDSQTDYFSIDKKQTINNFLDNKETTLDLYINSLKMIERLIYYRYPADKKGIFSTDNIVNLNDNEVNTKNNKKSKKIVGVDMKKECNSLINENIKNIGISNEDAILFESHFECGNLQLVYLSKYIPEKKIQNYQLFLNDDTNSNGYTQWFFFRISNCKKGKKINLNIMNLHRKKSFYSNGIKVLYYSKKKFQKEKIGWHHTNEKVEYNSNFLYKIIKCKRKNYYSLSFDYTFEYDNDEVYFANSIPFTFSNLNKDLNEYTKFENEKYLYFQRKKLTSTISGNDVDYFIINNNINIINYEENNAKKNGIVLFARQHPGETVSSWVIKGAIDFLMGNSDEAKYLRDNFIIKIIPMVNVDGVICGNSRTSLAGCDLNRRWKNPTVFLHPEIYALKNLIIDFNEKTKVEYIIDFHGHFGSFNSFFYANHYEDNPKYCRLFPFICSKLSKTINFEKSNFQMPKYKNGTGRINLFHELNIENTVTLEISYFGCNEGLYKNQYYNTEMLKEIGRDVCNGILFSHYNSNINNVPIHNTNLLKDYHKEKILENYDYYISNINKRNEKNNEKKFNIDKNNNKYQENTEDNNEDNSIDYYSDSESEPSEDNIDEEQINKLLNTNLKTNRQKGTNNKDVIKFNFTNRQLRYTKSSEDIGCLPILNKIRKNQKYESMKLCKNNNIQKTKKNLSLVVSKKTNSNSFILSFNKSAGFTKKDKATQTEEMFFSMHWSSFLGTYKIVSIFMEPKNILSCFSFDKKFKQKTNRIKGKKIIKETVQKNDDDNNNKDTNKTKLNKELPIFAEKKIKRIFHSNSNEEGCIFRYIDEKNSPKNVDYNIIIEKNINNLSNRNLKGNLLRESISSFISKMKKSYRNNIIHHYLYRLEKEK